MTVVLRTLLASLALTLMAAVAAAQNDAAGESGSRENPIEINVEVDAHGFTLVDSVYFGNASHADHVTYVQGDWHRITVYNNDLNASHTITLSGHDVSITVGADDFAFDTTPFEFTKAGTFTLRDEPSGDTFEVRVGDEDTSAGGDATSNSSGIPALPAALLAVAVLAIAALRRR